MRLPQLNGKPRESEALKLSPFPGSVQEALQFTPLLMGEEFYFRSMKEKQQHTNQRFWFHQYKASVRRKIGPTTHIYFPTLLNELFTKTGKDIRKYTLTEHFIRNTCRPTYSCNYLISQSRGNSAMHKIRPLRVRSFS